MSETLWICKSIHQSAADLMGKPPHTEDDRHKCVPAAPANEAAWKNCIAIINSDLETFIDLLRDPNADIFKPFSHGSGQTLLREALLIADHNSYHTGEIVVIRRLLRNWN